MNNIQAATVKTAVALDDAPRQKCLPKLQNYDGEVELQETVDPIIRGFILRMGDKEIDIY